VRETERGRERARERERERERDRERERERVCVCVYTYTHTHTVHTHTHAAEQVACVVGCDQVQAEYDAGKPDDVYLAYLPLAHIMEIAAEMAYYARGVTIPKPQTLN